MLSEVQMLERMDEYSEQIHHHVFVKAQVQKVLLLLTCCPSQRAKILRFMGRYIKYNYVAPCTERGKESMSERVRFYLKRLLLWPYYPVPHAFRKILSTWHPANILHRLLRN